MKKIQGSRLNTHTLSVQPTAQGKQCRLFAFYPNDCDLKTILRHRETRLLRKSICCRVVLLASWRGSVLLKIHCLYGQRVKYINNSKYIYICLFVTIKHRSIFLLFFCSPYLLYDYVGELIIILNFSFILIVMYHSAII